MAQTPDFVPGLEGVVAFETTIAEPDREGGALRYRGVDVRDLAGSVPFGEVWGLLVDDSFERALDGDDALELPVSTGDVRVDVQAGLATLAATWGLGQLLDISAEQAREDLARTSLAALSIAARSARGDAPAVPESVVDRAGQRGGDGVGEPTGKLGERVGRQV